MDSQRLHDTRASGAIERESTTTATAAEPCTAHSHGHPSDDLNGATRVLHQSLTRVRSAIAKDAEPRVVVLTGNGYAFSAGGDFGYKQNSIDDGDRRTQTMLEARAIVRGIVRLPILGHHRGERPCLSGRAAVWPCCRIWC